MNGILIALSIILALFIIFMVWGLRKAKQWRAEQEDDLEIADNMRDYWRHKADGAE